MTGGAGYIGSHVVRALLESKYQIVVIDDLSNGKLERIPEGTEFYKESISSEEFLRGLFSREKISAVINLAAFKSVEESFQNPKKYKDINVDAMGTLLQVSIDAGTKVFVQSSSASVYGGSKNVYVDESEPLKALSPYGQSKIDSEELLNKAIQSGVIKGTSLRYFNVAGSKLPILRELNGANIIPVVLSRLATDQEPLIFGNDYPTPDGTCVRDYIHVEDIARAHVLAVDVLLERQIAQAINIGTGRGYSVMELLMEILRQKKSTSIPLISQRRQGDPAMLVAKVELAKKELGFVAQKTLGEMVASSI